MNCMDILAQYDGRYKTICWQAHSTGSIPNLGGLSYSAFLLRPQPRLHLRVWHPAPIHPHLCVPGEDDEGIRHQRGELRGGVRPGMADQGGGDHLAGDKLVSLGRGLSQGLPAVGYFVQNGNGFP